MGMRRAAFLLSLLASCGPAPAGAFPADLVGTWAPADSKLDGDKLVEGGVLYLTIHGTGAAWGTGPPPLGGRILAWYHPGSRRLYFKHEGSGGE